MTAGQAYQPYWLTVAPGATTTVSFPGRFVTVLESNLNVFRLGFDGNSPQEIQQGVTIETEEGEFFKTFEIFNPNLADLVCLVATGRGRVIDSRLSTTGVLLVEGTGTNNALRVEGTGPGDEVVVRGSEAGGEMRVIGNGPGGEVVVTGTIAGDVGSTIDSQSDLSVGTGATQVAAQNLSRLVMILKSGHTNTAPIRVGDGGVVAGSIPMNGYELLPGESVELKTTAAIFARADAPGQRLSRVEISL